MLRTTPQRSNRCILSSRQTAPCESGQAQLRWDPVRHRSTRRCCCHQTSPSPETQQLSFKWMLTRNARAVSKCLRTEPCGGSTSLSGDCVLYSICIYIYIYNIYIYIYIYTTGTDTATQKHFTVSWARKLTQDALQANDESRSRRIFSHRSSSLFTSHKS